MRLPLLVGAALLAAVHVLPAQEIQWWQGNLDGALAAAKEAKAGMALVYCWKDDHAACSSMFQGTLKDKAVAQGVVDFVCMGAKLEEEAGKAVHQKFSVSVVPTVLFLKPDGSVEDVLVGVLEVKPFLAEVERIRSGKDTIAQVRKAAEASPGDLALQLKLAKKLRAAGDKEGAGKLIDAILAKDPKAQGEPAAEALLDRIAEATFRPDVPPDAVDLKQLKEFLVKQKNKRILFLGYDKVAAAEWRRNNVKMAAEAVERAWKNIPPEEVLEWGNRVVAYAYEFRKDLDKNQQKLALEIGKRSIAAAEVEAKKRPDGDTWLAERLYTFAACQLFNNLRKEAFATMERAIQLDPTNENLKKALEAWKDGAR